MHSFSYDSPSQSPVSHRCLAWPPGGTDSRSMEEDAAQLGRGNDGRSVRKKAAVAGGCAVPDSDDDGANKKRADSDDEESDDEDEDEDFSDDDGGGKKPAALPDSDDEHADHAEVRARYKDLPKKKLKARLRERKLSTAGRHKERIHRLVQYDMYDSWKLAELKDEATERDISPAAWNRRDALVICLVEDDEDKKKLMVDPCSDVRPKEPKSIANRMKRLEASVLTEHGLEEVDSDDSDDEVGDVAGPSKDDLPAQSAGGFTRATALAKARNGGILITGPEGEGTAAAVKRINTVIEKTTAVKAGKHGYNEVKGKGEGFTDNNAVTCIFCNRNIKVVDSKGGGTYQYWKQHAQTQEHQQSVKMGFKRPGSNSEYLRKAVAHLKKGKDVTAKEKRFITKNIEVRAGELDPLSFECKECQSTCGIFGKDKKIVYLQYGTIRGRVLDHVNDRCKGAPN